MIPPPSMGLRLVRLMTMKLVRLARTSDWAQASPRMPLQIVALARVSLHEMGFIRSANQPPRPVLLISTLISGVRWPSYNYLPHRPVRLKRPLSGNGSKGSIPHEVDVGRLPVLQSPRGHGHVVDLHLSAMAGACRAAQGIKVAESLSENLAKIILKQQ